MSDAARIVAALREIRAGLAKQLDGLDRLSWSHPSLALSDTEHTDLTRAMVNVRASLEALDRIAGVGP